MPKLGQLKQLPTAEPTPDASTGQARAAKARGMSTGATILFSVMGLIAVIGLVIGGYSGIRWSMLETPQTSEDHIASVRQAVTEVEPAMMVREFEDMEKLSIDLTAPYGYKRDAREKAQWGWSAVVGGGIGVLAIVVAAAAATLGREDKQVG
ncbi:hypothetical protein [Stieleria varia]|uniref:hypothetical protein n=1 Tax=Stieleria varia TaxID=2528005 RepID=UPI0011B47A7F|nr:hypothetical protein [Stieleria varia]